MTNLNLATKTIEIHSPAREVWQVLGRRFGDIGQWCATVNASEAVLAGETVQGRECDTVFGNYVETFEHFDDAAMEMDYIARSKKLPFFIQHFTNSFRVRELSENSSEVTMIAGAVMSQPFAFLMGFMMRMQVGKALEHQVEELKHFVEHGAPHPRKIAAMQKHAREVLAQ
ncbi:MAG: SRPBCC family protein [Myxococcota bacterium]